MFWLTPNYPSPVHRLNINSKVNLTQSFAAFGEKIFPIAFYNEVSIEWSGIFNYIHGKYTVLWPHMSIYGHTCAHKYRLVPTFLQMSTHVVTCTHMPTIGHTCTHIPHMPICTHVYSTCTDRCPLLPTCLVHTCTHMCRHVPTCIVHTCTHICPLVPACPPPGCLMSLSRSWLT